MAERNVTVRVNIDDAAARSELQKLNELRNQIGASPVHISVGVRSPAADIGQQVISKAKLELSPDPRDLGLVEAIKSKGNLGGDAIMEELRRRFGISGKGPPRRPVGLGEGPAGADPNSWMRRVQIDLQRHLAEQVLGEAEAELPGEFGTRRRQQGPSPFGRQVMMDVRQELAKWSLERSEAALPQRFDFRPPEIRHYDPAGPRPGYDVPFGPPPIIHQPPFGPMAGYDYRPQRQYPIDLFERERRAGALPQSRLRTPAELAQSLVDVMAERAHFESPQGKRDLIERQRLLHQIEDEEHRMERNRIQTFQRQIFSPENYARVTSDVRARQQGEQAERMQVRVGREVEFGKFGAALMGMRDEMEKMRPIFRTSAIAWAAGTASMMGFVRAASPETFRTVTGSLQLLAGEIGIALIPHMVDFSGRVQAAAGWFRDLDRGTKGALSGIIFYGTVTAGLITAFGWVTRSAISTGIALNALAVKMGITGTSGGAMSALTGVGASAGTGAAAARGMGFLAKAGIALAGLAEAYEVSQNLTQQGARPWWQQLLAWQYGSIALPGLSLSQAGAAANATGSGGQQRRPTAISMDLQPQLLQEASQVWAQIQTGAMRGPLEQQQFEQQMRALDELVNVAHSINDGIGGVQTNTGNWLSQFGLGVQ